MKFKSNSAIPRQHNLLFAVLITLLSVPSTHAWACRQWTIDGENIEITQSNGFTIYLSLVHGFAKVEDRHPFVYGQAYYNSGGQRVTGKAGGTLNRDKFLVTVQWDNATRGNYQGDIDSNGEIVNGRTWDSQHPQEPEATWYFSRGRLSCMLQ